MRAALTSAENAQGLPAPARSNWVVSVVDDADLLRAKGERRAGTMGSGGANDTRATAGQG